MKGKKCCNVLLLIGCIRFFLEDHGNIKVRTNADKKKVKYYVEDVRI